MECERDVQKRIQDQKMLGKVTEISGKLDGANIMLKMLRMQRNRQIKLDHVTHQKLINYEVQQLKIQKAMRLFVLLTTKM